LQAKVEEQDGEKMKMIAAGAAAAAVVEVVAGKNFYLRQEADSNESASCFCSHLKLNRARIFPIPA
jgi:hypothetical protein